MSLPPHKKEVKALVSLLEEDWETPEELAKALIKALDKARSDRVLHIAVMQFGEDHPFYMALGPFAGVKGAMGAVEKFPGATVAHRIAVVPMMNDEGIERKLREVG